MLQPDPLLRVERGQVVEEDLLAGLVRALEVDGLHLQEGEVALRIPGGPHLPGDGVSRPQVEAPDLGWRDVDVVGTREVVVVRGSEEAESVGKDLQDARGENQSVLFRLALENLEDQLLLPDPAEPLNAQILGDVVEIGNGFFFELRQVHPFLLAHDLR